MVNANPAAEGVRPPRKVSPASVLDPRGDVPERRPTRTMRRTSNPKQICFALVFKVAIMLMQHAVEGRLTAIVLNSHGLNPRALLRILGVRKPFVNSRLRSRCSRK